MWEFLVFGSLGFWILSAIGFILVLAFIVEDKPARASGIIFTYLVLSYIFGQAGHWAVVTYILANPLTAIFWVLSYFAAGVVWGTIKWYFFLLKERDRGVIEPPQVRDHRRKVGTWMGYWPFSLLWSMMGDVLTRAWKFIIRRWSGLAQSMSDRMFPEGARKLREAEEERKARSLRSRA